MAREQPPTTGAGQRGGRTPRLNCTPLHADLGVRIDGVDLAGELDAALFAELLGLYYAHSLVLFPGQSLTPAAQARLAHRFGKPKIETRKQFNLRAQPEVSTVGNLRDADGTPLAFFNRQGVAWHTDGTAACHVDAATFLYAVEVPRRGGDTLYCSTAAACERLAPQLRERVARMRLLCSFHAHNDKIRELDPEAFIPLTESERAALPPVWHPVVQTHPVTGREVLYLYANPLEIDGVEANQGQALLDTLFAHCTRVEHVYRHRWSPGDLVIWDNHATMHSATEVAPYENDRRLMHRSFVYTWPTERPLHNLEQINAIFARPT